MPRGNTEPTLTPNVLWPGVSRPLSVTYTCSHGIGPGSVVLTIPPTALSQISEVGDLIITDGYGIVTLTDCHVVEPSYAANASGQTMRLVIEDRRWRWRLLPPISGNYNILEDLHFDVPPISQYGNPQGNRPSPPPIPHGEEPIREGTRKTLPELAQLLLDAMGETNYLVTGLDERATPSVNWDVVNPAQALQQLVSDFGCRVIYQPLTDTVLIAQQGEGGPLPDGRWGLFEDAPSLDVKARPERITCFGGPARWQMRFSLEAVGLEFDGKYLPIDELSYKPITAGGWSDTAPPSFAGLPGRIPPANTNPVNGDLPGGRTFYDARALAQHCIYKMYRITLDAADRDGPLTIPPDDGDGPGEITDVRQVKLFPVRNVAAEDDLGQVLQLPAVCYGTHSPPAGFFVGKDITTTYQDTDKDTEVKVTFTIDQKYGVIVFDQPVLIFKNGKTYPAELDLECAAEVLDPETWSPWRYQKTVTVDNGLPGTTAFIVREDVKYQEVAEYKPVTADSERCELKRVVNNAAEIAPRADHYLIGESLRYMLAPAQRRTYLGIEDSVQPDGAVMQVTWSFGGGAVSTTATMNGEHNPVIPTYAERRQVEETGVEWMRRMGVSAKELSEIRAEAQDMSVRGS